MRVTELVVENIDSWGGKEILKRTGEVGRSWPGLGEWMIEKKKAEINVRDVTHGVVVIGVDRWVAFEEECEGDWIRTVLSIS